MKKSIIALTLSVIMVLAMMVPAFAQDAVGSTATISVSRILEESWTWHITPDAPTMNITTTDGNVEVGFDPVGGNSFLVIPTEGAKEALAIQISARTNEFQFVVKNNNIVINNNENIVEVYVGGTIPEPVTLTIHSTESAPTDNSVVAAVDTKTATITFQVVQVRHVDG